MSDSIGNSLASMSDSLGNMLSSASSTLTSQPAPSRAAAAAVGAAVARRRGGGGGGSRGLDRSNENALRRRASSRGFAVSAKPNLA